MNEEFQKEIRILEENIDIERAHLSFEDTFEVIFDYLKFIIFDESNLAKWNICEQARRRAEYYFGIFFEYWSLTKEKRKDIDVMGICDAEMFLGSDRKLIELVTFCLWEKQDYIFNVENYMQDNFFAIVMMKSNGLCRGLSKVFREFVESHPAMCKYKL